MKPLGAETSSLPGDEPNMKASDTPKIAFWKINTESCCSKFMSLFYPSCEFWVVTDNDADIHQNSTT